MKISCESTRLKKSSSDCSTALQLSEDCDWQTAASSQFCCTWSVSKQLQPVNEKDATFVLPCFAGGPEVVVARWPGTIKRLLIVCFLTNICANVIKMSSRLLKLSNLCITEWSSSKLGPLDYGSRNLSETAAFGPRPNSSTNLWHFWDAVYTFIATTVSLFQPHLSVLSHLYTLKAVTCPYVRP